MSFEEEGYISTGTSLSRAPIVGQLVGRLEKEEKYILDVKRLLTNNQISKTADQFILKGTEYYIACDLRVRTLISDLKIGDLVNLTTASDTGIARILVTPILKVDDQAVPPQRPNPSTGFFSAKNFTIVSATRNLVERPERFELLIIHDSTKYLDEKGQPVLPTGLIDPVTGLLDPDIFRKTFPSFFIEGELRTLARGPRFLPSPQLSEIPQQFQLVISSKLDVLGSMLFDPITKKYVNIDPEKTTYVHPAIPPFVLQPWHMMGIDHEYRSVYLPKPSPAGQSAPKGDYGPDNLIEVRELITPLLSLRGTVETLTFDATLAFRKVVANVKPTKHFINIHGTAWEWDFPLNQIPLPEEAGKPPRALDVRDSIPELLLLSSSWFPAAAMVSTAAIPAILESSGRFHPVDPVDGGLVFRASPEVLNSAVSLADHAAAQVLLVRLRGSVQVRIGEKPSRNIELRIGSAQVLSQSADSKADYNSGQYWEWIVHLKPKTGPTVPIRYPGIVNGRIMPTHEQFLKVDGFLHPVDSVGFLVDVVTSSASRGLGWPQGIATIVTGQKEVPLAGTESLLLYSSEGILSRNLLLIDKNEVPNTRYRFIRNVGDACDTEAQPGSYLLAEALIEANPPGGTLLEKLLGLVENRDETSEPLLWVWSKPSVKADGLPLYGEVTADRSNMYVNLLTVARDSLRLSIQGQSEKTLVFPGGGVENAPRRLDSLVSGETVWARVEIVPDAKSGKHWFQPRVFRPQLDQLQLSAVARGQVQSIQSNESTEGFPLAVRLIAPRTESVLVLRSLKLDPNEKLKVGEDFFALIQVLTKVNTLSKWLNPKPIDAAKSADPVHAVTSDMIARWSGWSLTTKMPGRSNLGEPGEADTKSPFRIHASRKRPVGVVHQLETGDSSLPRLRFGQEYEFCLRRVDLAGNQLFDDGPPSKKLTEKDVQKLTSILEGSWMLASFPPAKENPTGTKFKFTRADVPFSAPIVFPVERIIPIWATAQPDAIPPATQNYRLVETTRDTTIVYFSDVLERYEPLTTEASGWLLPPSAPVETVLMHGVLDHCEPHRIPQIIQLHERYLDTVKIDKDGKRTPAFLGLDQQGCLNYFGDPQVESLVFELSSGANKNDNPPKQTISKGEQCKIFQAWPRPRPVEISVAGCSRPRELEHITTLHKRASLTVSSKNAKVEVQLPPGADQALVVLPIIEGPAITSPQNVRLLHVVNGPWVRPKRPQASEILPTKRGDTVRLLQGQFEVDPATTESYSLTVYWNECWDESLPYGWEEARIQLTVKDDSITAATLTNSSTSRTLARGYGYGTQAAVLIESTSNAPPPRSFPILAPVVYEGGIGEKISTSTDNKPADPKAESYNPNIAVISAGEKFDPKQHRVRIIRRPPMFSIAEAKVTERMPSGALRAIEVTCEGGWYAAPPFVVAHDLSGDGYGAILVARLNGRGGVDAVDILSGGTAFSKDVAIRFYTHQQSFPPRKIASDTDSCTQPSLVAFGSKVSSKECASSGDEPFRLSLPETGSRRLDCVITLHGKNAGYLLPPLVDGIQGTPNIRTPVPRHSPPLSVTTTSTEKPLSPRVAHLLPSFRWDGTTVTDEAQIDYFLERKTGELRMSRRPAIRVYLRRPWHSSGSEYLGVVIIPAILNTTRLKGDLNPDEPELTNRAEEYPNLDDRKGVLPADVIPPPFRNLATRWGYDPIRAEAPLPPLGLHHFPDAISQADFTLAPNGPTGPIAEAKLALHQVQYDGAKNLWYADIGIDSTNRGVSEKTYPFVRLNLVAFQPHSLPDLHTSEVVTCDFFPMPTQRVVRVTRKSALQFTFELGGHFSDEPKRKTDFPRRRVVVELQARDPELAPEIEFLLQPGESYASRQPLLWETELSWNETSSSYRGQIDLAEDMEAKLGKARYALVLREKEYYRTLSPQPSASGDRAETLNGAPCAVRTLTSFVTRI